MLRTASGQKVAHDIRTIECGTGYGFTRRLSGAETSVQKILLVVSRPAERERQPHHVQLTRAGRCIVNQRNGSKIPMHLKTGVYTIKLWVEGEKYAKNTHPKIEELGTWSGGNCQAKL